MYSPVHQYGGWQECVTEEFFFFDGFQPVSLQQQHGQVVQVFKSPRTDAADLVVGQSQLPESSW